MNVVNKDLHATPKRTRIIVTGLSGAGRASSLHILEDEGFELVDNPPLDLLKPVLVGSQKTLAVGIDTRTNGFSAEKFASMVKELKNIEDLDIKVLYLFADTDSLLARFTKTRRKHPLSSNDPGASIRDAIERENISLQPVREVADISLDTSGLSLAELHEQIVNNFCLPPQKIKLNLMSFAYPVGVPREADLVFDARFLRNPYYDPKLQMLNGTDPKVQQFVFADKAFPEFIDMVERFVRLMLPRIKHEGKQYFTVAIGCSGGHHRSVSSIEELASRLKRDGIEADIAITHRELNLHK